MTLIEWKEEFALGVPGVDHEHRELIELINQLHAEVEGAADRAAVIDFLGELHASISAHFALEERMMREADYDEYDAHKDDHERLLDDIHAMIDDVETGSGVDFGGFSARLDDWFSAHFRTLDARLHDRLG